MTDKNRWSLGLFDCLSYQDSTTSGCCCLYPCIPVFFPQAVCGSCFIEGEIHTIMYQEKTLCCRMGGGGWCRCLTWLPISLCGPFGGVLLAFCFGPILRNSVVSRYDISDSDVGTCGGFCYPCSLFQILFTLRDYERQGIKPKKDSITTPLV